MPITKAHQKRSIKKTQQGLKKIEIIHTACMLALFIATLAAFSQGQTGYMFAFGAILSLLLVM